MRLGRALSKVQSGILKGAGKSLGAARAWYHCMEEMRWNRRISS